jgi:hypothetical protein
MPLPEAQYWTKLPAVTPDTNTSVAWLSALHTALSSAVDQNGDPIPASHQWTSSLKTGGVEISPPAGSEFTGKIALIANSAMLGSTTKLCSWSSKYNDSVYQTFTISPGAVWTSWDDSNGPWGSASWSTGVFSALRSAASSTGPIQVFLSDEKIAIQARLNNQYGCCCVLPGVVLPISSAPGMTDDGACIWGGFGNGDSENVQWWLAISNQHLFLHNSSTNHEHKGVFKRPERDEVYAMARDLLMVTSTSELAGTLQDGSAVQERIGLWDYSRDLQLGELRDIYFGPSGYAGQVVVDADGREWYSFGGYSKTSKGHCCWLPGVL